MDRVAAHAAHANPVVDSEGGAAPAVDGRGAAAAPAAPAGPAAPAAPAGGGGALLQNSPTSLPYMVKYLDMPIL
jgi:hypothetical protein